VKTPVLLPRSVRLVAASFVWLALSVDSAPARGLANFDVRASLPADRALVPEVRSARLVQPGAEVQADLRFGVPSFVWGSRQPAPVDAQGPEAAARRYLEELAPLYRLSAADAAGAVVTGIHDTGRGAIIVQFGEQVDGIQVYATRMSLAMDRQLRLVAVSGSLSGASSKGPKARAAGFGLGPRQALAAAMTDLGLPGAAADAVRSLGRDAGAYERFEQLPGSGTAERLIRPARVRSVYLRLPGTLEPAYSVEVEPGLPRSTGTEGYEYVISALDGRVLVRRDLVAHDSFNYRVWAETTGLHRPLDGPTADFSPHPTGNPDGSAPGFIPPNLVMLQNGPISTNDAWLAPGANETKGNNVDAYADLSAPDGFSAGDLRAGTTAALTFNRTYDTSAQPDASSDQIQAAVTQLFYVVNWLHDWFYDAGFDEAAGNAQQDNYGRGGVGGDPLHAEAQDYGGTNNANMSTPADGASPRMQMYLWDSPTPKRDGSIDNQIVAHEWGHYLFHRLVAASNQQSGAMSEGWSDFIALMMTAREGDNFDGAYPLSGYATTGAVPSNPFYFGIRRYPYSTDFSKDPLTFHHIDDSVALPDPNTAPFSDVGAPENSEVHNAGEIWATMMWGCYAGLLKDSGRLTFTQAQDRMRGYVVAAFKMTPADPTFVEQRDAVLAAMFAGDPADFQVCAQAFAQRGMGSGAVAPARDSTNNSGVVESYVLAPSLAFQQATLAEIASVCPADGIVDNNEQGTLSVTLKNAGFVSANATTATVSSATTGVLFPNGGQIVYPPLGVFGTGSGSVLVTLGAVSGIQELDLQIAYRDPNQAPAGDQVQHEYFLANADVVPNASASDGFEAPTQVWTAGSNLGSGSWQHIRTGVLAHRWQGPDVGGLSDHFLVSPPIQVAATGSFGLSFQHRHSFEGDDTANYDGGVIEIQQDPNAAWQDISVYGSPGYGGTLSDQANNPLSNRQAYVRQNASYPALDPVTIDLGTALQGKTVRIRFRIGCDEAVGDAGWEVDDVAVTNAAVLPFPGVIAQQDSCLSPTATPTAISTRTPTPSETSPPTSTATPPTSAVGQRPGGLSAALVLLAGLAALQLRSRRRPKPEI
jgi:fungalysin metallopeptidase (M36)